MRLRVYQILILSCAFVPLALQSKDSPSKVGLSLIVPSRGVQKLMGEKLIAINGMQLIECGIFPSPLIEGEASNYLAILTPVYNTCYNSIVGLM